MILGGFFWAISIWSKNSAVDFGVSYGKENDIQLEAVGENNGTLVKD